MAGVGAQAKVEPRARATDGDCRTCTFAVAGIAAAKTRAAAVAISLNLFISMFLVCKSVAMKLG
jgi:hypothetical protein